MLITDRPYDELRCDFEKMWDFIREDYAFRQDHFIWLFSRLGDWKYGLWSDKKLIPTFFRDYAHLWVDSFDQLLGFVLSENGDNIFYIFTRQGFDFLYPEILDWTIRNWSSQFSSLKTEVHEFQKDALAHLEQRGFHSNGVVATTREYNLQIVGSIPASLPEGFDITDMSKNHDYRGKAELFVNGFDGRNTPTEMDLLKFAYSRESPAYDSRFDLSVISPEGLHAATCMGFNDPLYSVAEVEKVCTHSRYRRLGLAETVIRECFRRLKNHGIQKAYITGYNPRANSLYEKLGPCSRKQWFHYELIQDATKDEI